MGRGFDMGSFRRKTIVMSKTKLITSSSNKGYFVYIVKTGYTHIGFPTIKDVKEINKMAFGVDK